MNISEADKLFLDLFQQVAQHAEKHGRLPAAMFLDSPRWETLSHGLSPHMRTNIQTPFNPVTRLYRVDTSEELAYLVPMEAGQGTE